MNKYEEEKEQRRLSALKGWVTRRKKLKEVEEE